jgi:sortase A
VTEPAPAPAARRPSRGWSLVGVLGEILITLGVLLLLMVVYQLWWTNVEADRATAQAASSLQQAWTLPDSGGSTDGESEGEVEVEATEPEFGDAFALMYIPRLRDKVWGMPVVQGVEAEQLAQGIGHYTQTAGPGEVGNFAVAAHRATNGEPFRNIDQIREGDEVYVETRDSWYVYRLDRDEIVLPIDTWVIDPVPGEPDATPTEELITLTTCNPRWASYERWIWWGTLVETVDKASGTTPDAILAAG